MQHKKDKKKPVFVHQPEYPGGPKAMTQFIYANLKYPPEALAANTEGTVLVDYDIDYKGNVIATRVLIGLGNGCDEEACRVVKMFKFDVAKTRGMNVLFHQKVRIQFKKVKSPIAPIPSAPATINQAQYAYTIVPSEPTKPESSAEPQATTTFSYTITIS